MPLTSEQKEILRLLLANRTPQSYLAGGAALNRKENSPRYSRDLDIFHETQAEVAYAADKDREILERTGYKFEWLLQQPGFFRAIVAAPATGAQLKMEWAVESSFRFFPLIKDKELGYRLHNADLATNKILALAGRQTARDFIDALYLDQTYLSLGALAWAASGKDPGLTPELILNEAKRESRYSQQALEQALADMDLVLPVDVQRTKQSWLQACSEAERLFEMLPLDQVGCLYLGQQGKPKTPTAETLSRLKPHFGTLRGTLPRIIQYEKEELPPPRI
jgi:hypothetical protein